MTFGELQDRIEAGDKDAEAYLDERFGPIGDAVKKALAPITEKAFKAWTPPALPKLELDSFESAHEERMRELQRLSDEVAEQAAEDRRAAIEREEAMRAGIKRLANLAQQSVANEIDSGAREHRMVRLTVIAVVLGGVSAIAAVVTVVVSVT